MLVEAGVWYEVWKMRVVCWPWVLADSTVSKNMSHTVRVLWSGTIIPG